MSSAKLQRSLHICLSEKNSRPRFLLGLFLGARAAAAFVIAPGGVRPEVAKFEVLL
jgi:hypothetical protein